MDSGDDQGLSPELRNWSVLAFMVESLLVIAAYLVLLFWGSWQMTLVSACVIILVMVLGAIVNIFVFYPWYRKAANDRQAGGPEPEHRPDR